MNLADILSLHARERPEALAAEEGDLRLGYRDFDRAVWRAAAALRARGIGPGDVVGVAMRSCALHLVVAYALARMGAVLLSLPLREPVSVRQRLAERFRIGGTVSDASADPAWLEGAEPDERLRAPGGEAPSRIVLSSGTTASPKAVLRTHAAHIAWRRIYEQVSGGGPGDRFLSIIELDFYAGLRQCMEVQWSGGTVVFPVERLRTPEAMIDAAERDRVSSLHLMPTHLHRLLAALPEADAPRLPRVRVLRTGAMIVSQKLRRQVQRRLTPNLLISYGTNDVGSILTYADAAVLERHPGATGVPSPGVELQIVDDEGRALPAGEPGLIRARAPGMPAGYIDNPEASAIAFRDGWYYPGDLGMVSDEGALYFKGRADDLMNFEGIKLYPSDIEAALAEHPAVVEAAAFPLRSEEHQDIPVAAVVLRDAQAAAGLAEWCRERLGTRAPQIVAGVASLPRNAMGKVLKRELALTVLKGLQKK